MDNLRFDVVKEAFRKRPVKLEVTNERPSEQFGKYVFSRDKMYKYLPVDIFNKMMDVMENGERLDRSIADGVANGMKKWAKDHALHTIHTGFSH